MLEQRMLLFLVRKIYLIGTIMLVHVQHKIKAILITYCLFLPNQNIFVFKVCCIKVNSTMV